MAVSKRVICEVDGSTIFDEILPASTADCKIMHLKPWARRNFRFARSIKVTGTSIGQGKTEKSDREIKYENPSVFYNLKLRYEAGESVPTLAFKFKLTQTFINKMLKIE